MAKKKHLKYQYKTMDVELDKDEVQKLQIVNPRKIRAEQVSSILASLNNGVHFDVPFVVNCIGKTKETRVIDGNHRTIAMKKYFESHPDDTITVPMNAYFDLTVDEEREIYTKTNRGVSQSADDFLNSYSDTIKILERLTTEIPCSIYGSSERIKARYLLESYLSRKQRPYEGGHSYRKLVFIKECQKLTYKDFEDLKETWKILFKAFNPDKLKDFVRLDAFKATSFPVLFHLVSFNKTQLGREYVMKRMKKVLYDSPDLHESRRWGGRYGRIQAYLRFQSMLNKNTKKKFK